MAMRVAKHLLDGVGALPSALEQMQLAFHYRRSISEAELAQLPADWCAIQAIDTAGHGLILERDT